MYDSPIEFVADMFVCLLLISGVVWCAYYCFNLMPAKPFSRVRFHVVPMRDGDDLFLKMKAVVRSTGDGCDGQTRITNVAFLVEKMRKGQTNKTVYASCSPGWIEASDTRVAAHIEKGINECPEEFQEDLVKVAAYCDGKKGVSINVPDIPIMHKDNKTGGGYELELGHDGYSDETEGIFVASVYVEYVMRSKRRVEGIEFVSQLKSSRFEEWLPESVVPSEM